MAPNKTGVFARSGNPDFADLTGDGEVTEADLALMMRLVHGQEPPELLFEETIGPGGGSIGDEETINVETPAGAFDSDSTLTVHRLPKGEDPSGGTDHGPLYQVTGIPYNTGDSLNVHLPLPEGFDPGKAFIEVGEPGFSTSGYDWQYQALEAQQVDGMLEWEMEPIPEADLEMEPAIRLRVSLWETMTSDPFEPQAIDGELSHSVLPSTTDEGRFRMHYSRDDKVFHYLELEDLLNDLGDAYDKLDSAGFKLSEVSWPVRVYMKDLGDEDGAMVSSRWGDYIELNRSLLATPSRPRVTAGHEFFHIAQAAYGSPNENLWLDEATATWFEKFMAPDSDKYEPDTFRRRPRKAFRGMHVEPELRWRAGIPAREWDTSEAEKRGYALSGLIEYMDRERKLGLAGIRGLYEDISNGTHPIRALNNLSPRFSLDWREYTKAAIDDPVWSTYLAGATIMEDKATAFDQEVEGAYGRREPLESLADFGALHEVSMHVQQLGGRSLTLKLPREPNALALLHHLPDEIRMIGEVQADNPEDISELRLAAALKGGLGNMDFGPFATELDADEVLTTRPDTRRIEFSFPPPDGSFRYMLTVFNDNTRAPYDEKAPVTLRSYIGAYSLPSYETTFSTGFAEPPARADNADRLGERI